MKLTIKNLFLLDGIGALLTTLLLSQVLARFETAFGMPTDILYPLAITAGCFAIYSINCFFFVKTNGKRFLQGIAVANAVYCMVTFGLLVWLFDQLTYLGLIYFLGEIAIVLLLVKLELRFAGKA